MADRYIERLFRRLLLAGVPILPVGAVFSCSSSSCPDNPPVLERYVEIANPAGSVDAGVTADAYQRCVDTLDCNALCVEAVPFSSIKGCERVATDGFASGSESVALDVHYVTLCEGRRPEGHTASPRPRRARCDAGAWLARAAFLERISVPAFERLARELAAHGAPKALVDRARRSAREETRHERMMTALARRHAAEPAADLAAIPSGIRPLAEVATENAAEGCVRETFGAVVSGHQAVSAADPAVRATMRAITRDETRHAALAWDVHAWSFARLPLAARRRLRARLHEELDVLAHESRAASATAALIAVAGLPTADDTDRILAEMRASV